MCCTCAGATEPIMKTDRRIFLLAVLSLHSSFDVTVSRKLLNWFNVGGRCL
jgi:hypothetical protein